MNPKNKKIDGKAIASRILDKLEKKVSTLSSIPTLAIILVDSDFASKAYVRQKVLAAKSIGVKVIVKKFTKNVTNEELLAAIQQFNKNNNVHGIIVQRPLPPHIDTAAIDRAVTSGKDVDGFSPNSKFDPPIGKAILRILVSTPGVNARKNIIIIGKGETGGKFISQALRKIEVQPLIIDSKTKDPQKLTKKADIIISAVGKPNIIKLDMIKKGVVLISVGLHKGSDGKLHGDYEEEKIKNIASFYTPTPGGVGPVNVACLLENLVKASFPTSHF